MNGGLANKIHRRDVKGELSKQRALLPFLRDVLKEASENASPMDVLRTIVSASSFEDPLEGDNSPEAEYQKAIRLVAKMPTILAAYIRRRQGQQPIPPDPALGHAANFPPMTSAEH